MTLAEELLLTIDEKDALQAEVERLREGVECHIARPGEGTYECSIERKCPACRLRHAEAEVEQLRGLVPDLPPRPPEGVGLLRYGIRHNGPTQPLAVPMADGYWTPWHLAEAALSTVAERQREADIDVCRPEYPDCVARLKATPLVTEGDK